MKQDDAVKVKWGAAPLDVKLKRHGMKAPDRKVEVRGIKRDDWLEKAARIPPGSIRRLMKAVAKAMKHGYEPRLDESVRFVHLIDPGFRRMRISVQAMGDFRNCLEDVEFSLHHGGKEVSATEAEALREIPDPKVREEVTPDVVAHCPKCGTEMRIGRKLAS